MLDRSMGQDSVLGRHAASYALPGCCRRTGGFLNSPQNEFASITIGGIPPSPWFPSAQTQRAVIGAGGRQSFRSYRIIIPHGSKKPHRGAAPIAVLVENLHVSDFIRSALWRSENPKPLLSQPVGPCIADLVRSILRRTSLRSPSYALTLSNSVSIQD